VRLVDTLSLEVELLSMLEGGTPYEVLLKQGREYRIEIKK